MINPLSAQGPCLIAENGTVPNPDRWTGERFGMTDFLTAILKLVFLEHFNLIALDHVRSSSEHFIIIHRHLLSLLVPVHPMGPKSTTAAPLRLMFMISFKSSSVSSLTLLSELTVPNTSIECSYDSETHLFCPAAHTAVFMYLTSQR
jgi:hypothetical protein